MNLIRALYRSSLSLIILTVGGTAIVITSFIPLRIRDYPLSMWALMFVGRALLWSLDIKVACAEPERFRYHEGFIFPNHISYLDILVLISIAPVRFLAKDEIRSWFVVGQAARAIGCVFVKRESKASRHEARSMLTAVERFPPIVLFPEGKKGPGDQLKPFRYGAFEVVIQGEIPFLPCAIVYSQPEAAIWYRGEAILKAMWRLTNYGRQIQARLILLDTVYPQASDDPVQSALETQTAMTAVLEQEGAFLPHPPKVYVE